jgi:hypothetical protein
MPHLQAQADKQARTEPRRRWPRGDGLLRLSPPCLGSPTDQNIRRGAHPSAGEANGRNGLAAMVASGGPMRISAAHHRTPSLKSLKNFFAPMVLPHATQEHCQ